MTRTSFSTVARALLLAACSTPLLDAQDGAASRPQAAPAIGGVWRAEATLPSGPIEAFLEIEPGANPAPVRITVLKMGLRRARIAASHLKDGVVELETPALGGGYRGTLSADGRRISGRVTTIAGPMLLDFARADAIPHRWEPVPPFPYGEEEVAFWNDEAKIRFRGTLTAPRWPGPHPAVVMITGAGCQDRNAADDDGRPFLVIADWLTRRGVAVLRFDDRGFGATGGSVLDSTTADFASDALAAIAFLGRRPEIDRARIGLIGHDEGALAAMMAAALSPEVKFVVSLAGIATKCDSLAYDYLIFSSGVGGLPEPAREGAKEALWRALNVAKSDLGDAEAAAQLSKFLPREAVSLLTSRWTRFILRVDPSAAIERVRCPLLALYGAEDRQVRASENAAALQAASRKGGNQDVTIVTLPRLDHVFRIASPTAADGERCNETIAPEALDAIATWVSKKT